MRGLERSYTTSSNLLEGSSIRPQYGAESTTLYVVHEAPTGHTGRLSPVVQGIDNDVATEQPVDSSPVCSLCRTLPKR